MDNTVYRVFIPNKVFQSKGDFALHLIQNRFTDRITEAIQMSDLAFGNGGQLVTSKTEMAQKLKKGHVVIESAALPGQAWWVSR